MSQSPSLNIAVIGVGLVGPRHCKAIIENTDTKLVAIVDSDPQSAHVATDLGTTHYASVSSLLASTDKPTAAVVCTPNHTHVSLAKELLEGGVHVLVEKPLGVSAEECKELLGIIQKTGFQVLVGHHRRFNTYMMAVKEALVSGVLGDITAVNSLWTLIKPPEYFEGATDWRKGMTGGPVLINSIHDVDLMHYLFGPISRVYGERAISRRSHEAEEGVAVTFRFESGVVGTFLASDNVSSPYNFEAGTGENWMIKKTGADFYRIFGTHGTLSVPDMTLWYYADNNNTWTNQLTRKILPVVEGVPFELQLQHFVRVARGLEDPLCTVSDGIAALVVCDAIKESSRTGQAVEVNVSKC